MPGMALMLKAPNRRDTSLNDNHLENALFHSRLASVVYVMENLQHGSDFMPQIWKAMDVRDKLNFDSWLKLWLRSGSLRKMLFDLCKNYDFVALGNNQDHVWESRARRTRSRVWYEPPKPGVVFCGKGHSFHLASTETYRSWGGCRLSLFWGNFTSTSREIKG